MVSGSQNHWLNSQLRPDQKSRVDLAARLAKTSIRDLIAKSVDEAAIRTIEQHKAEFGASSL
jgi:uncharacterized protein (DUF1778 family)